MEGHFFYAILGSSEASTHNLTNFCSILPLTSVHLVQGFSLCNRVTIVSRVSWEKNNNLSTICIVIGYWSLIFLLLKRDWKVKFNKTFKEINKTILFSICIQGWRKLVGACPPRFWQNRPCAIPDICTTWFLSLSTYVINLSLDWTFTKHTSFHS